MSIIIIISNWLGKEFILTSRRGNSKRKMKEFHREMEIEREMNCKLHVLYHLFTLSHNPTSIENITRKRKRRKGKTRNCVKLVISSDFYILMHTKKFRLKPNQLMMMIFLSMSMEGTETYPYVCIYHLLKQTPCHESSKKWIQQLHLQCPLTLDCYDKEKKQNPCHLFVQEKGGEKKKEEKKKECVCKWMIQGDLQPCKPMSLCFLDGPEDGMGRALGKNPKKWPELWDLGFNLKTWELLEPWQWPAMKKKSKNNQSSTITGLLQRPILEKIARERRWRCWCWCSSCWDWRKTGRGQETWANWMQNRVCCCYEGGERERGGGKVYKKSDASTSNNAGSSRKLKSLKRSFSRRRERD